MTPLRLTLDTNQLDDCRLDRLRGSLQGVPHELACVTVTARERGIDFRVDMKTIHETAIWGESRWGEGAWGGPIPELLVLDESTLDEAVLGSDGHVDIFETALRVISNGSFPRLGKRESLSDGERRQLRDAMVFEAHVRARRHVLVTLEAKGFTEGGRRESLQRLGRTWILMPSELESATSLGQLERFFRFPE